jgi:hypothetical protein
MWLARAEEKAPNVPLIIIGGPRSYVGDHPGFGLGVGGYSGGGTECPAISSGPEYSGNGGAGTNRRGGW